MRGGRVPYVRPTGEGGWGTPVDDNRHSNDRGTKVRTSDPAFRRWSGKVVIPCFGHHVIRVKFTALKIGEKNIPSENPQKLGRVQDFRHQP